jgi:hypothetical protein
VEPATYPPPTPTSEPAPEPAILIGLVYGVLAVLGVLLGVIRPEGDLVVTGTTPGYVYMFGGAVAALAAIVWTRSARPWVLTGVPRAPEAR